jgi:uncharacterized protein
VTGVRPFLTAEWRHLAMLNYRVAPELLLPFVPAGTELDSWNDCHYLSVVGFLFQNTRVFGAAVPFHRNFEEVNLRFYVRRRIGSELRRAVCFVRELVPRAAIAAVARLAYNEPYRSLPMAHRIEPGVDAPSPSVVEYRWRLGGQWNTLSIEPRGQAQPIRPSSEEEFIAEHYWGYTRQRDGGTLAYEVRHPPWEIWNAGRAALTGDLTGVYGPVFAAALRGAPTSAFLSAGSAVSVFPPVRLSPDPGRRARGLA